MPKAHFYFHPFPNNDCTTPVGKYVVQVPEKQIETDGKCLEAFALDCAWVVTDRSALDPRWSQTREEGAYIDRLMAIGARNSVDDTVYVVGHCAKDARSISSMNEKSEM